MTDEAKKEAPTETAVARPEREPHPGQVLRVADLQRAHQAACDQYGEHSMAAFAIKTIIESCKG